MSYDSNYDVCSILMVPDQKRSEWLLGDPAMFGYYTIHDTVQVRFGLVGAGLEYASCNFMCNLS